MAFSMQNTEIVSPCIVMGCEKVPAGPAFRESVRARYSAISMNISKVESSVLNKTTTPGSPSELNQHTETLKDYFAKNPPSTTAQAQKAIEKLTGLHRSLTQIRDFLKRLGMKRRKVGSAPGKADDPDKQREQREFLETQLNPRLDEAEQGKRKIFL